MNGFKQWALDIRDLKGFMLRAFICVIVALNLIFVLMILTLSWVHPNAETWDVFRHYLSFMPAFFITVPLLWLLVCWLGIAKWYVSYIVSILHAIFACIYVNLTRERFMPNAAETIYFDAVDQGSAFLFVLLSEFCYFWLLVGVGASVYVYLTENWFPTMATWFKDDPLDQSAAVSRFRPAHRGGH